MDGEANTTPELAELMSEARRGNSDAQFLLAHHYAEVKNFEEMVYWLEKSVDQGNEYAIELLDLLQ